VHSEDIRRPLGIAHIYPADAAAQAAAFYANSNLIMGGKNRVAGLTLAATDTDWKIGSGPVVEGPVLELVLAIAGRKAALAHLTGDGLDTLQSRV
jgi:hypothetical protein